MCATQLQATCVSLDRSSTLPRVSRIGPFRLAVVFACLIVGSNVAAQSQNDEGLPPALLLTTNVQRGKPVPELDKQIQRAVIEHAPVHLVEGPAKKLSTLQAAARCHDESVNC